MPRYRRRACLQDGLKLDLNLLIRQGAVRPGFSTGPGLIEWICSGQVTASAVITANLCDPETAWLSVSGKRAEPTDHLGLSSSTLWRQAVVLHLPVRK
jgi:hypothetical protein